jgi:uncharacterized protein with ParB-like and HNH nuclease domain
MTLLCIFSTLNDRGLPLPDVDVLRYIHHLSAKEENKSTTTEASRKLYKQNNYKYLKMSIQ